MYALFRRELIRPLDTERVAFAPLRELSAADDGRNVTVAGWAEDVRNLGGIAFVILRQREGTLQLAVRKREQPAIFDLVAGLTRESVIAATGVLKANPLARNGWEIFPTALETLSSAAGPPPPRGGREGRGGTGTRAAHP